MNQESIDAKTASLIKACSRGAGLSAPVREWYRLFPHSFYRIARKELSNVCLHRLIAEDEGACRYLCDTTLFDASSAVTLAGYLAAAVPDLDVRLVRTGVEWLEEEGSPNALRRCLIVLDSLKPSARVNTSLVRLLGSSDGAVKSKVIELLIRTSFNEQNIRTWLTDPDPRVRANLLEVLSKSRPYPEWICEVLVERLSDSSGRTAANAAVALFRTRNEAQAIAKLNTLAVSRDPSKRCSAAWALGQLPEADVMESLKALRADTDDRVRWNALKSLSRVRKTSPKMPEPPAALPEIVVSDIVVPEEPKTELAQVTVEPPAFTFHTRTFGRLI